MGKSQLLREIEEMNAPYSRREGISPHVRTQLMLPGRSFKYEVKPNPTGEDGDMLHTIFPHRAMKALELSTMTERELLALKAFLNNAIDHAMQTVVELDRLANEALAEGRPSKRLYRPDPKLLIFPEGGGVPDEWEPDHPAED